MAQILRQLKETVGTLIKNPHENYPTDTDVQIQLQLGLQGLIPQDKNKNAKHIIANKDFWQPPPQGFMKCNIDGASKGNPGTASYKGVIRDEKGCIEIIFHNNLGKATNDMAKLVALEKFLEILRESNLHNTIIEADYELIINSVKKICYGSASEKVSRHWRLLQVYQRIQSHLQNMRTLSFTHVRRTTNKLMDILAN